MRRFFVKNILFILAINILVKPIWVFFIDRTVQNRVAGGDYGTYQALLSLSIIFQIVLDFGITNYNSRTIAQNPDKLPTLFPAMLSARLVLSGAYMLLAFGWGLLLGYRGWELNLLIGVLLIQALNSLLTFIRSNIAALHKFKTDGILSITDRLLMVFICGFLLINPATANNFKIQWFVITQIGCYSITAIIAYFVLRRIAKVKLRFAFDPKVVLSVVKGSMPYALLIFQMSVYNRADAMLVERISGKAQSDIWASAFRLIDMANMVGLMFATMLLPLFGRLLSTNRKEVQPIVRLCANLLVPFSFAVAVAGVLYSSDIMQLLYNKRASANIHDYQLVFAWLIASFPAWCLMYIYSTLLTSNGNLKVLNMIAFGGVVLNLTMNAFMIPYFHATGAAVTSCVTQSTLAIAFVIACTKIIGLPVNVKWVAALLGYLGIIIFIGLTVKLSLPTGWIVQAVSFMCMSVLCMFVFRFVSLASIKELMNRKKG